MQTSASQFALWMEFLDWEANAFNPLHCYLAQIAMEIRQVITAFSKYPKPLKLKDFLLKFVPVDAEAPQGGDAPRPAYSSDPMAMKRTIMAWAGLKPDGTPIRGAKRKTRPKRNK